MKKSPVFMALLCIFCQGSPLFAADQRGLNAATSRFAWENDFYFFRDAQISNIFSYQQHSAAQPDPNQEQNMRRSSWGLQQTMQTPQKSTPSSQLKQDVPFVGTIVFQQSWYDYNDCQLSAFGLSAGMVGALSLAQPTQKLVHTLRGVQVYAGWSQQFPNEPLLNAHALKKIKLAQSSASESLVGWDISAGASLALGNLVTQSSADIELRLGYNMPTGFAYIANTFGFDVHYMANSAPKNQDVASLYASFVARGTAVAYNIYLDGSMFQQAPFTYKNNYIAVLIAGIHYEAPSFALHFNILASRPNINTKLANYAIGNERIGSFTYDWRY